LLADCSTRVIYNQEASELSSTASLLGLSSAEMNQISDLQQGEGLWQVGRQSFVVRHQSTTDERELFNTNFAMTGTRQSHRRAVPHQ
jgi:hypothetical protein